MKYRMICGLLLTVLVTGTVSIDANAAQIQKLKAERGQLQESAPTSENTSMPMEITHVVNSLGTQDTVLLHGGVQEYLNGIKAVVAEIKPEETAKVQETEVQEPEAQESEYSDLALTRVTGSVNVRESATTESDIVGKIHGGAVAHVLETVDGENGEWFKIISGNVEGYMKAEFFLYGDAAAEVMDEYVTKYAVIRADRLNVRREASIESERIGYVIKDEKIKILEDNGEWLKVQYTNSETGFVSAEYVIVSEEFIYAKTLEEEAAEAAARKSLEERKKVSEAQVAENTTVTPVPSPVAESADAGERRAAVIEYAKQFLGNKYVSGGNSLTTGTDCSGFTSLIYAQFGYSLSRIPEGQWTDAGRSVTREEAQPGDIVCYDTNGRGKCTHVALYMGDGQIIHSANPRSGVVTAGLDIHAILGIKRIIE